MKTVTVSFGDENIDLPLESNNKLKIEVLKLYFPSADGLIYEREGRKFGLSIDQGYLNINPDIQNYKVHVIRGSKYVTKIIVLITLMWL